MLSRHLQASGVTVAALANPKRFIRDRCVMRMVASSMFME